MSDFIIEHDHWNHSPPKLPPQPKIVLPDVLGVLPFDGVRNPGHRSATSQHVWFTYRTEANNWELKVGVTESAAEFGVGLEGLLDKTTFDIKFQPCAVPYFSEVEQKDVPYHHDFLVTRRNGHRRLVFVRNSASLSKQIVWRDINKIAAATKKRKLSDDMIVVNADTYTRQRRDNLFRMWKISDTPDPEADKEVLAAARKCRTLWYMKDLFPLVGVTQPRAFDACYRLIGKNLLGANMDNVIWEHSRVWVAP